MMVSQGQQETSISVWLTLFRGSTVHQVGPMRQDVSWVIPLYGALLPKLGCSCLVQCRPLPGPLGAQKQGETAAPHLCAGLHCFPYPTWGHIKEAAQEMWVCVCFNQSRRHYATIPWMPTWAPMYFLFPRFFLLLSPLSSAFSSVSSPSFSSSSGSSVFLFLAPLFFGPMLWNES